MARAAVVCMAFVMIYVKIRMKKKKGAAGAPPKSDVAGLPALAAPALAAAVAAESAATAAVLFRLGFVDV